MFVLNLMFCASILFLLVILFINIASEIKNKQLSQGRPIRSMTRDEISAIQPFIHHWPSKRLSLGLRSNDVHSIVGEYNEHRFGANGHRGIDRYFSGMKAILPFDAMNFMVGTVEAEVVVTRHFIILISSSNGFNIVASARKLETQIPKDEIPAEEIGAIEFQALAKIEEINTRQESLIEARHFRTWDQIWYIPVFYISAIYMIRIGYGLPVMLDTLLMSLGSAVLIGTELIYYYKLRWVKPKRMVRELKGRLFEISIPALGGKGTVSHLFLGTETALQIPKHWRDRARKLIGTQVRLGLSSRANHVVAIDKISSLESEEHLMPAQPWGGHVAALLMGFWVIILGNSIPSEKLSDLVIKLLLASNYAIVVIASYRLICAYRATAKRNLKLSEFSSTD